MTFHNNTVSKETIVMIESCEGVALISREDALEDRVPVIAEGLRDSVPIIRVDALYRIMRRNSIFSGRAHLGDLPCRQAPVLIRFENRTMCSSLATANLA